MLKVRLRRCREFEDEYAEMALGIIENMRTEVVNRADGSSTRRRGEDNLREFYERIVRYGLAEAMGLRRICSVNDGEGSIPGTRIGSEPLNGNGSRESIKTGAEPLNGNGSREPIKTGAEPLNRNELREFIKSFLLASPEMLRGAYLHLQNLPPEKMDYAQDEFLHYLQDHAYSSMCGKTDGQNVKYNIRILQALGIKVCPYCGCAYIGGRGDAIFGAELDHFYNRSKYPFFALCLYNLVPSCKSCNNHKSDHEGDLVSPFEEKADFDANVAIRLYSRPYVRETGGEYRDGRMRVVVTADKGDPEYERYKSNVEAFALEDVYAGFEEEATEYIERMIRYPKSQMWELEDILSLGGDGVEKWWSKELFKHGMEWDLFLGQCEEGDKQAGKLNSKMYTDLYRNYRRHRFGGEGAELSDD